MRIRAEIERMAKANRVPITEYEDIVCRCGGTEMRLHSDDDDAGAYVTCAHCKAEYDIAESRAYIEDPIDNLCNCGAELLAIGVGIAFKPGSNTRKWVYVGGHCKACGESGVYTDWKEI